MVNAVKCENILRETCFEFPTKFLKVVNEKKSVENLVRENFTFFPSYFFFPTLRVSKIIWGKYGKKFFCYFIFLELFLETLLNRWKILKLFVFFNFWKYLKILRFEDKKCRRFGSTGYDNLKLFEALELLRFYVECILLQGHSFVVLGFSSLYPYYSSSETPF